jgi:hypothetical protein
MKTRLLTGLVATLATGLLAADSNPKDKLANAAKQLAGKPNYSWTTSTTEADGTSGRLGPIDGKADKEKLTFLSFAVGGVPVEVYMKADKGAAKALEGWMTLDEIAQTSGTAAAVVRYLKSYKAPAAQSADLVNNLNGLKEAEEVVSGELKDEPLKELLLVGTRRRDGQEEPKINDGKGTAKFWIKEGVLTKYELKVQGKVVAGERTLDIDRTTTVEIKDIGSTKLEVPDEAKQKMS